MGLKRISELSLSALKDELIKANFQAYRAKQIVDHIKQGEFDFLQMKTLPEDLRQYLNAHYTAMSLKEVKVFESNLDETHKYLFALEDGAIIEAVFMSYTHGNSVCITTQVGCKMGCTFCASYIGGFKRHLTTGEMLEQLLFIQAAQKKRVTHVVLMGSGEPLDNYDNVLKLFKQIASQELIDISLRHITVSTSGIVPRIHDLAKEGLPITLAISLHAPNDLLRSEIMPINDTYPMGSLLDSARVYAKETGRRVTFEYALIEGVNDSSEHARELASRLKGILCHVNLIPINPIKEKTFKAPHQKKIQGFYNILDEKHIPVSIRRELGGDIDAACGQLRNQYMTMKGLTL